MEKQFSAGRHAVDGIGHEVGEDLAQFTRESTHRAMRLEAFGDVDAGHLNLGRVQSEDTFQDLDHVDLYRRLRFAMKGQELAGDLGNAGQFFSRHIQILASFGVGIGALAQQEQQV